MNKSSGAASASENYAGVWDNRVGFGKKAALVVIDFVKAYTLEGAPLFAAGVAPAVEQTKGLLESARRNDITVIHTTVNYNTSTFFDGGVWVKKAPVLKCLVQKPFSEVCEGVEPLETETVISKQYASAFFGTSLASMLTAAGIDTIVLAGCSTSGCIRATAVDGVQNGFRVIVPRECVGDRHEGPHEANLFDINSKYGDVVSRQSVIEYFNAHVER
ncbi:isochorismatase family protein [Pseudomonas taiwanensis]|uniref:Isochorismatase family protein n=1 Tax=Pseudomonas taiwanensis TaxID=470150 RepID=A0ABR6VC23_9PSED|nr:isochorismatase family protein [Pseudomonas taiwanensis]MBC3478021.1 isochorismatase family protein [Pseudomonas taiwanensis]